MTTYSCTGLFPYRFAHPERDYDYSVVIAQFLQMNTHITHTVFFYSKEQLTKFLEQEWWKLTPNARFCLVEVIRQFRDLPDTTNLIEHEQANNPLAIFFVLSGFIAHTPLTLIRPAA